MRASRTEHWYHPSPSLSEKTPAPNVKETSDQGQGHQGQGAKSGVFPEADERRVDEDGRRKRQKQPEPELSGSLNRYIDIDTAKRVSKMCSLFLSRLSSGSGRRSGLLWSCGCGTPLSFARPPPLFTCGPFRHLCTLFPSALPQPRTALAVFLHFCSLILLLVFNCVGTLSLSLGSISIFYARLRLRLPPVTSVRQKWPSIELGRGGGEGEFGGSEIIRRRSGDISEIQDRSLRLHRRSYHTEYVRRVRHTQCAAYIIANGLPDISCLRGAETSGCDALLR